MTFELVLATAYFTCGAIMLFLGLVILRENPRQRVNWAVASMLVFGGLGPILGAFQYLGTLEAAQAGLFQDVFARFAFLWEFFFPATLLFALVFPVLNPLMRRFPWTAFLLFAPHLAHVALVIVAGGSGELPWPDWAARASGPLGSALGLANFTLERLFRAHVRFFSFINLSMAIASVVILMRSAHTTSNPKLRSQVRAIQRGLGFALLFYSSGELLPAVFGVPIARATALPLITVSLAIGAASIVIAIVRLGFLDVRFIVRRGLVYGLASGVIVATYLFIGKQIDRFSAGLVGEQLPVFETTFLVLSLFLLQPVLSSIERLVDRGYARDRTDLRNSLGRLSENVSARLHPDEMARTLAESLAREMVLEESAVLLRDRRSGMFRLTRAPARDPAGPIHWKAGTVVFEALRRRRDPVPASELAEIPREAEDRELLAAGLAEIGARHAIALLGAGEGEREDELVGVLFLGAKVTQTRIPFEEMSLVLLLARQAGIALQNAAMYEERIANRLLEEEVATARRIQQQLLPESPPSFPGWDVHASNEPSRHVGGDYHDFLPLPGGEIGIAIGDVSGKGVPAALLMSNLQAALRGRMFAGHEPERVVEDVNREICRNTGDESFISFFLGQLRPESGSLRYTNAGHNAPVLVRQDGRIELLEDGGLLLGIFPEATYEVGSVELEPGDVLALYTDGVTEASNPEGDMFGEERLMETLTRHRDASAPELHRRLLAEVQRFQAGNVPDDDLTLVLVKRMAEVPAMAAGVLENADAAG
jgi:sigma-B regulation protein RsbU (phosphoserine phosphatase)